MSVVTNDRSREPIGESANFVQSRALLVEPRILRRVIRLDRHLAGLGLTVPHASSYVIERARLLAYTELEELELPLTAELPRDVILLAKLGDEELSGRTRAACYRQQLFHSQVHYELQKKLTRLGSPEMVAQSRWHQIGAVEHDEIHSVLAKDGLLFSDSSNLETYIEFVAVYLELHYFAPEHLPACFPAIKDWSNVDRLVSQDVNHRGLFESVRLEFADIAKESVVAPGAAQILSAPRRTAGAWWLRARQLPARARRASAVGNSIRAAILWTLGGAASDAMLGSSPPASAVREIEQFAIRLQPALQLTDEQVGAWVNALCPLLGPAASDIWTVEARLLYDLEKACVEYERGVFKLDLGRWLRDWGRCGIRRPLPLLRDVLITKNLRSATRRLASARLTAEGRERLSVLLAEASQRAEHRVRQNIRPLVLQVLDEVGLKPTNTPEQVARLNVAEELLDVIVEQGVANLGHFRDAISRNDIKLPDLGGPMELIRGDVLLHADRELANRLAGVYRRGAIYLSAAQRLSSLAFGTRTGRFLTRYVALPYGGAFLAWEGVRHLFGFAAGHPGSASTASPLEPTSLSVAAIEAAGNEPRNSHLAIVVALGTFLLFLLHSPRFRNWCQTQATVVGRVLHLAFVELPSQILNSPVVQDFLRGPTYLALRSYVIWPGIITILCRNIGRWTGWPLSGHLSIELFLVTALFLNSRIGRYLDERVGDLMLRVWQELRMRVVAALFEWIMDQFHRLFAYLERIVYTVDEWLRFRVGDRRWMQAVKLLSSMCWFFISYVVILVFTLLIEPQVNPIKHFPVVTVSHKLLLPAGPAIVEGLAPLIGGTRAATLVWSTIWLIPGVFGFLVWELKENWRLYAANRPTRLTRTPVGHHGETMVRLLRPGFHSGTLPKLFAGLRSAIYASRDDGDLKGVERKHATLRRVEEAIRRFVQRKFIMMWEVSGQANGRAGEIKQVRLATSRIEVDVAINDHPDQLVHLRWVEHAGELQAHADAPDGVDRLDPESREACAVAITGLFQRSGADTINLASGFPDRAPMDWHAWVSYWSK